LSNKLKDAINDSKSIKKMTNVTTLQAKQEIKRCDVTYIISVVGLASQEVDVLANLTNEKL
jgi:hypothetical protein